MSTNPNTKAKRYIANRYQLRDLPLLTDLTRLSDETVLCLATDYDTMKTRLWAAVIRWWKEARTQRQCWRYVNDLAHSRLETISKQAATIKTLKITIDAQVEKLKGRRKALEEQVAENKRLRKMAQRLAISWAQAWKQDSLDEVAWKDEYDQALRDRRAIIDGGIDAALTEEKP